MMLRVIGAVFLLSLASGCCVVDSITYEPTIEEQLDREQDVKKNPLWIDRRESLFPHYELIPTL